MSGRRSISLSSRGRRSTRCAFAYDGDYLTKDGTSSLLLLLQGFKFMNDPRNTDHAWIVSHADHFHDSDGTIFDSYDLKGKTSAGVLDVVCVCWL